MVPIAEICSFYTPSAVDEHLDSFQVGTFMNETAIDVNPDLVGCMSRVNF